MDVFCVHTQIFLIIICLPMLDYLHKYIHGCILRTYADIPNNFDRPMLDFCAYEQIPHRDMSVFSMRMQVFLIVVLVFQCWVICAYNQVYIHTWMYSAYVRRYS